MGGSSAGPCGSAKSVPAISQKSKPQSERIGARSMFKNGEKQRTKRQYPIPACPTTLICPSSFSSRKRSESIPAPDFWKPPQRSARQPRRLLIPLLPPSPADTLLTKFWVYRTVHYTRRRPLPQTRQTQTKRGHRSERKATQMATRRRPRRNTPCRGGRGGVSIGFSWR